jgi:hypothetical protein
MAPGIRDATRCSLFHNDLLSVPVLRAEAGRQEHNGVACSFEAMRPRIGAAATISRQLPQYSTLEAASAHCGSSLLRILLIRLPHSWCTAQMHWPRSHGFETYSTRHEQRLAHVLHSFRYFYMGRTQLCLMIVALLVPLSLSLRTWNGVVEQNHCIAHSFSGTNWY